MKPWHEEYVREPFDNAGVTINGPNRWDVQVKNPKFYSAVVSRGTDGFADAFVKGYWECLAIDECVCRLIKGGVFDGLRFSSANLARFLADWFLNKQSVWRSRHDISRHYNLGPVFEATLGGTMSYTCGYWKEATTLDEAQDAKHRLICKKLGLRPGMSLLDVGCGWGGFMWHAAKHFGVRASGVTISHDQVTFMNTRAEQRWGSLNTSVRVHVVDWRQFYGIFDRVVVCGMIEHVGPRNYRRFLERISKCLAPEGLFLLHTIGARAPSPTLSQPELTWVGKHIFPGAALPSMGQITTAADGLFSVLDMQDFGSYYHPTLMAWAENFERNWPSISHLYSGEFYRMWLYYLRACAGFFLSGKYRLWQIVFAKGDYPHLYEAVR